ncbi:hypothetical protein [Sulfitobacter sp. R18_1]|uniref:hypothetical protein n=1 Tax=Sulfitobacter sp. R18_1 TaxID=2821104 RepID=UPI001AD9EB43|nr:hypothetical protein [Sulfitobacter sp. R18_1]MBO9428822.1 hypothetical protein [Sulfitobacter sp. R18_1]
MHVSDLPYYPLSQFDVDAVGFTHALCVSRSKEEADDLIHKVVTCNADYAKQNAAEHHALDLRGKVSLSEDDHRILIAYFGLSKSLEVEESPNCLEAIAQYIGRKNALQSSDRLTLAIDVSEEVASLEVFQAFLAQARSHGISLIFDMNPESFRLGINKLREISYLCQVHLYAPDLDRWGYIWLFDSDPKDYSFKSIPKSKAIQKAYDRKPWPRVKALFCSKKRAEVWP